MSKELIRERDEQVDGLRRELRALVRESDYTQRQIEEQNGFAAGYLSQVLQGHIGLTVRHLCGILLALDIEPQELFTRVIGPARYTPDNELRERLARYDAALEQLERKGLFKPEEDPEEEDP